MRVSVDGQTFNVPDDATPEEIDAISRPSVMVPPDTHSTLAKVAHYGAKALPLVGTVAGGILAGAPAIPTGPGALLTGVGGAALGGMAGKAGQKAIDQALGYEQPDLKRDLIDVGTTGLQDAAMSTGAGVAVAGAAKVAPAVAALLKGAARGTEKRVLSNVFGSLSKTKPLSDAVADTAAERGVFKTFGTSSGAAGRMEAARETVGDQYGQIIAELKGQGITGPDAMRMAQDYATRLQGLRTMNPSVPKIYESAADMVSKQPTVSGRLDLADTEQLKRSLQGMAKSAYKQMQPNEVGRAHEETASMMRQAVEDAITQQTANASPAVQDTAARFVPVKQELGKLIEGSNVAREGMARESKRSYFSLPDIIAATSGYSHSGSPLQAAASGVASHLLRTRGPSTAAVALRGASNLAGAFPSIAPQAERAAMSLAPALAERPRGWIDELLRLIQQKSSPATVAQADQQ